MTKPATATTPAQRPAEATRPPAPPATGPAPAAPASRTSWLALTALGWLVLTLMISRSSLVGGGDAFDPALAATTLPLLVQASLVAGAAVGLWAVRLLAARVPSLGHGVRRYLAGLLTGLLTGALASGIILVAYGVPASAAVILALAMGLAGAVGGVISAAPAAPVLTVAVVTSLASMVLVYTRSLFDSPLMKVFGDDGTAAGRYSANGLLAGTTALLVGVAVGLIAFWMLRRARARSGEPSGWPSYLLAGGAAGVMLMTAELFTRLGVPQLLSLTSNDVTGDQLWQSLSAGSRLNTGMVVFFVGAITAIIGFGRSLPKRTAA